MFLLTPEWLSKMKMKFLKENLLRAHLLRLCYSYYVQLSQLVQHHKKEERRKTKNAVASLEWKREKQRLCTRIRQTTNVQISNLTNHTYIILILDGLINSISSSNFYYNFYLLLLVRKSRKQHNNNSEIISSQS